MNKKPLTKLVVLSLFDGIGAGREALARLGYTSENLVYYASEINPWAIRVALKNHPDIIHVGDVTKLNPKNFRDVNVIIGGSPCQDLSRGGKKGGITTKNGQTIHNLQEYLKFKNEGVESTESALYWEYVRMYRGIKEYNPELRFFLENVVNKQWGSLINISMAISPRMINSSVLTAQNRERNYWTNIPCSPITDLGITLGMVVPGAVTGAGTRGRKLNGDDKYSYPLSLRSDNKANCLTCSQKPTGLYKDIKGKIKDLTPEDAEALQTFPRGYTDIDGISTSRRFELIGNSWTVDVIIKFFENIKSGLRIETSPLV